MDVKLLVRVSRMKDNLYADQPNQDSDLSKRNLTFLASASKTYLTHSQDVTKTGDPYSCPPKNCQKVPQHRISWISLPSLHVYSISDDKVQITETNGWRISCSGDDEERRDDTAAKGR